MDVLAAAMCRAGAEDAPAAGPQLQFRSFGVAHQQVAAVGAHVRTAGNLQAVQAQAAVVGEVERAVHAAGEQAGIGAVRQAREQGLASAAGLGVDAAAGIEQQAARRDRGQGGAIERVHADDIAHAGGAVARAQRHQAAGEQIVETQVAARGLQVQVAGQRAAAARRFEHAAGVDAQVGVGAADRAAAVLQHQVGAGADRAGVRCRDILHATLAGDAGVAAGIDTGDRQAALGRQVDVAGGAGVQRLAHLDLERTGLADVERHQAAAGAGRAAAAGILAVGADIHLVDQVAGRGGRGQRRLLGRGQARRQPALAEVERDRGGQAADVAGLTDQGHARAGHAGVRHRHLGGRGRRQGGVVDLVQQFVRAPGLAARAFQDLGGRGDEAVILVVGCHGAGAGLLQGLAQFGMARTRIVLDFGARGAAFQHRIGLALQGLGAILAQREAVRTDASQLHQRPVALVLGICAALEGVERDAAEIVFGQVHAVPNRRLFRAAVGPGHVAAVAQAAFGNQGHVARAGDVADVQVVVHLVQADAVAGAGVDDAAGGRAGAVGRRNSLDLQRRAAIDAADGAVVADDGQVAPADHGAAPAGGVVDVAVGAQQHVAGGARRDVRDAGVDALQCQADVALAGDRRDRIGGGRAAGWTGQRGRERIGDAADAAVGR